MPRATSPSSKSLALRGCIAASSDSTDSSGDLPTQVHADANSFVARFVLELIFLGPAMSGVIFVVTDMAFNLLVTSIH
jgi:hypothetical protein